jgi:hypothetical protein
MKVIDSYRLEWARTEQWMRVAIVLWLLAVLVFSIAYAMRLVLRGDYKDIGWAALGFLLLILLKVLWPFTLAAAIRRRGGSFGAWFLMGLIFGFLITGIWYQFTLKKLPVLPEYAGS